MRGNSWVTIVTLVSSLAATSPSLSQQNCNPRAGYPPFREPNRQFAGLFRIPLRPPDLRDRDAVQRHMVLAEVWGQIIRKEMSARTRDLCTAWFEVQGFPDSRVSLVVNRTASRIDREKSLCTEVLKDILLNFQPDDERVNEAVRWLESATHPSQPGLGEVENSVALDASNISQAILPLIYEKTSVLHALVSVGTINYSAVSAPDLRAWIQRKRSPELALQEMPHCVPPHGDLAASDDVPEARTTSGILPPGEIHLSRSDNWLLPPGPLRYAVVIGNPVEPPTQLLPTEVEKQYCWRDHTFAVDDGLSSFSLIVRPRCDPIMVFDLDAWIFIYCDPKHCTSERIQKDVMAAIARDPEILEYARRSSNTGISRGPYLVVIK